MKNTIQHPTRGRLVCKIWDNGGRSADRYTIVFRGKWIPHYGLTIPYLAASEAPFHPQGVGMYGELSQVHIKGDIPFRGSCKHLGKRIPFDALPPDVQKFVMQSI